MTDVVGVGRGALALIAECARGILRRAQEVVIPLLPGRHHDDALEHRPRATPATPTQGPHEAVEATKFSAGAAPAPGTATPAGALPRAYGVNRAVLTARDPCCLFVWWEVTPISRVEALRSLGSDAEGTREVLRVHRGAYPNGRHAMDLPLTPGADRWYLEVEPGDTWSVEVGLRTPSGRFVALVRSNTVQSPPAQPSEDATVRWVTIGRQGSTPAAAEWSGQWVPSESSSADLEPGSPRSSEALLPR